MSYRSLLVFVALAMLCAPAAVSAQAKPDQKAQKEDKCKLLTAERQELAVGKLRTLLKQDPKVVAATLPKQDLDDLRRLIELDEEIMFGCRKDLKAVLGSNPDLEPTQAKNDSSLPDLPVRRPGAIKAANRPAETGNGPSDGSEGIVPLPERRQAP
ncbi:MAG: hypothetical protein ACR2PA_16165 [Hyphomicrobiaceae bacterium]